MTKWHYVLTLEVPELGLSTSQQVVDIKPGFGRSQVYEHAVKQAVRSMIDGAPGPVDADKVTPITRFWSLEPESLEAR